MRTIAHLSDLHFGRTAAPIVAALHDSLQRLRPDLVVISGDFTQRAKALEFQEARAFLDALPARYIAVPGNHDIPLYHVYHRFVGPLQLYKRYVSETVEPLYMDEELTVVSVNTARSLTFKGGRISAEQVRRVVGELNRSAPRAIRILVAHHPLDLPDHLGQPLAARSRMAMAALAHCGLDMILSGHLHVAYLPKAVERLRVGGHTTLLVQAGTAVSTRSRGDLNSFNFIETQYDQIAITQHSWMDERGRFEETERARYSRTDFGWARQDE